MEEHSFQDRSNSGSLGVVTGQKPKLQPVRVKTLLESYESDDDSEDRERDSEKSEEESDDTDDFQPLPEDAQISQENNDNNFDDLKSIHKATTEISSTLPASKVSVVDPAKSEITDVKENLFIKENSPLFIKCAGDKTLKNSDTLSTNESKASLTPPALYTESNFADNLAVLNIGTEIAKRSKSHSPKPKMDEINLLEEEEIRAKETKLRHSGVLYENKGRKNSYNSRDTALEEFYTIKNKKIFSNDSQQTLESCSRGNEHLPVQRTLQTESASVASTFNMTGSSYLVNDTPLKQIQLVGSSRPTPCYSHKNLFMTPQNKVESDYQRNYAPTPATILSNWSQSRLQTPLQNQVQRIKEVDHSTGKSAVQSNSSKQELQRYYNIENRSVRRPLAETLKPNSHLIKENVSTFSLDTRQSSVQYIPAPKIEVSFKPIAGENNQDLKENKSPNTNEHLVTEMPPKSHPMSNKDLIGPKIMSSNFNQEIVEEVKEVPKIYPSINTNERPKIVERVPIISTSVVQNTHKDEFLRVKNVEYRNLGIIGKGMSGHVYRVQNLSNKELQAIKFVNLGNLDKEGRKGCLEEIRMLHKLQAPCIIRMFDYEVKENCIYVVMELGDTDLSNLIKANAVETDLYFILYYWRQMLTAVNHIHKNGVIHSDLKPGNFVLVKGVLKLIDFGIASTINADMTSVVKDSTTGTLNYISPEALTDVAGSPSQNAKHKINYKSDVWALGCILYSLVYGHTPFQDIRNQWQKISAIQNPKHRISFPSNSGQKLESVPPVLIDVMKKCLNRDSKARPTVKQLLEISYISMQSTVNQAPLYEIPAQIMANIKQNRLSEEEWRQFVQLMEKRRNP